MESSLSHKISFLILTVNIVCVCVCVCVVPRDYLICERWLWEWLFSESDLGWKPKATELFASEKKSKQICVDVSEQD